MNFDVIYVNYNSTSCLIQSIESLTEEGQTNLRLNIIAVDNFSDDNPRKLKDIFPEISLILNKENRGFGAAINQALPLCRSKYIILLNPDSLVSKGFLEESFEFMEQKRDVGIMGPMIVNEDGTAQGSARAFPTPLTALFGRNTLLTKLFPNNSITKANILNLNRSDTSIEVDWVSGACMVVRREAMLAVGGFDERFFLYWEDADICHRLRANGWRVIYHARPMITHFVGKSSNTRPFFANFQFHKNSYRLYDKYAKWPLSTFIPIVGIALMLRFSIIALLNLLANMYVSTRGANK